MPENADAVMLDALIARWGQTIRHAVADGASDVSVGGARGHVLALTSDAIVAALTLAHATLST